MSNNVDIFINGKTNFPEAAEKSKRGLHELNEALEGAKNKLRSYNAIFELGFGFQVGRKMFDQLHEAAKGVGEAFVEARKEGLAFWESVGEGIKHAAGIQTVTEKVKELKAALKLGQGEIDATDKRAQKLFRSLGLNPAGYSEHAPLPASEFSKLGDAASDQADAFFADIEAAKGRIRKGKVDENGKAVGDSYDAATARLGAHKQILADFLDDLSPDKSMSQRMGLTKRHLDQAAGLRLNSIEPNTTGLKTAIEEDQKAVDGFKGQIAALDKRASEVREKLQEKLRLAPFLQSLHDIFLGGTGFGQMETQAWKDTATGVVSQYTSGPTLGIVGSGKAGLSALWDSLSATGADIAGPFNYHKWRPEIFQGNDNLPPEINKQIDAMRHATLSPQQRGIEVSKIIGSFGSFFGLDRERGQANPPAENQRFLSMGKGQTKSPELTELEKNRLELQEIGRKLLPEFIQTMKGFLQKVGAA